METKTFHLGDILSVIKGRVFSPRKMRGVNEILDFMTGHDVSTSEVPGASDECKPHLLVQFPQLADVDCSSVNRENVDPWLAKQIATYGETFEVLPISKGVSS